MSANKPKTTENQKKKINKKQWTPSNYFNNSLTTDYAVPKNRPQQTPRRNGLITGLEASFPPIFVQLNVYPTQNPGHDQTNCCPPDISKAIKKLKKKKTDRRK